MRVYHVNSFTDKFFKGNPAGVCILEEATDTQRMQNIAMEMNLSETAFFYKEGNGFNLRWFTPESEVDLCGHATLASAHILWETGICKEENIEFYTQSGTLYAKRENKYIVLDFPKEEDSQVDTPREIKDSLNVPIIYTGKNRMDFIVEVENGDIVSSLEPDFAIMKKLDARGIIVTGQSTDSKNDFISRFFAPREGISEDPVTGSAYCCLAPYWERKLGKSTLSAYQASKRGGNVKMTVNNNRVYISGKAITVFCAEFTDLL